ncbi:tryptophan 2,3-dioxygenase [Dictyostelium purpureum]|uniref:Tryptophan 2,3-dioxygenase n=1 Tax=Dictyostelium purpureum TaxID=5786 RepID=F0ZW87_DICPU|nr:tryptophan 2,3-dioxygenase [Dictyostelium purpureum]EGC31793.1 tryptophan 2,3-dioxygenase [Dictyostelium purpureum]|eukprot:XP_003291688.1 tryptophan 2,3-dioxygenase [Dictyostelium purpureum]
MSGCQFHQPYVNNNENEKKTIAESIEKATLMDPALDAHKAQKGVYYGSYLKLNELLGIQNLESVKAGQPAHEEMLFIIIHQTYELWFKQIIHEIDSIRNIMSTPPTPERLNGVIVNRLQRVTEIQKLLVDQISILETMTSVDFLEFRNLLVPASGFQSVQFRMIENKLGILPQTRVQYQQHHYSSFFNEDDRKKLSDTENETSLLQLVIQWLERNPFLYNKGYDFWSSYKSAVDKILENDLARIQSNTELTQDMKDQSTKEAQKNMESFSTLFDEKTYNSKLEKGEVRLSYKALQSAILIFLYKDEPIFHTPFLILNLLTEIDEQLTLWRFRHTMMVQRIIGAKIGTGGSSGYHYLRTTVGDRYKIFLDLFNISSYLIPKNTLPQLPSVVKEQMDFAWSTL